MSLENVDRPDPPTPTAPSAEPVSDSERIIALLADIRGFLFPVAFLAWLSIVSGILSLIFFGMNLEIGLGLRFLLGPVFLIIVLAVCKNEFTPRTRKRLIERLRERGIRSPDLD